MRTDRGEIKARLRSPARASVRHVHALGSVNRRISARLRRRCAAHHTIVLPSTHMLFLLCLPAALIVPSFPSHDTTARSVFANKALAVVSNHKIVQSNPYTEWFATGEADMDQARNVRFAWPTKLARPNHTTRRTAQPALMVRVLVVFTVAFVCNVRHREQTANGSSSSNSPSSPISSCSRS